MERKIETWLRRFGLDEPVHAHACAVLVALPAEVLDDLINDPSFTIFDYEPGPGVVMEVPVGSPTLNRASRSVVLKRTLRHGPEVFARYVIAHELAHAHLRNEGRHPGEDPEHAADALAAAWGFPRPARWW